MREGEAPQLRELDPSRPVWEQVYSVAPLVLVGSTEPDGSFDIAPKHMATPLGWEDHFGFICTSRHRTQRNIARDGEFSVTYPRPSHVLLAAISASPPRADDPLPSLEALATFPASRIQPPFVTGGYLFLECRLTRIIDGFGDASLIVGRIVAAHADEDACRATDRDDADLVFANPLLAFLPPDRYAVLDDSRSFPFPAGFKR